MNAIVSNEAAFPPVRLGRISFINVDPIYYGFEHSHLSGGVSITSAPPAALNRMMAEGRLDISSVSSAAYAIHHREWQLLPGLSIACRGDVMSVLLVSRLPLEYLNDKRVLVTDDSATAVRLMRLMFYHHGISPRLETRKIQAPDMVDPDASAALVIGDAALRYHWRESFEYVWDLGDLWARHAKLPFVFAVWAVRKEFAVAFPQRVSMTVDLLHESKRLGISNIDAVIQRAAFKLGIDPDITRRYFNNFGFDFLFTERAGLTAFFDDLFATGIIGQRAAVHFFDDRHSIMSEGRHS